MADRVPAAAPEKIKNQAMEDAFAKQYARLNDAQRQAVDAIEGPVMVVAGPGTGKTQTISMRVANILRRTQMRPGNILCLTFSVSGATAMRERMRSLIGADAYGVVSSTIHAFAQSIIDGNPLVFEDWAARQQLSDIEKYRELNAIIDDLSGSDLINPKDPYAKDSDLLARISQVKREGKSLKDLERAAETYDVAMAEKSKPGTKAHRDNVLRAKKFRDFIEIYKRYAAMLEKTGRYDYDDMILHVIAALKENDWLLAALQERFQYVLVDEFQDLNGSQYALVELLTTYVSRQEPNLFVVGDDDQAIYRFQGANLEHMLKFRERFPKAPIITLTTSYRSTQSILDAAASLIERNTERLVGRIEGLTKTLTAASGDAGSQPTLLRPPSDLAEPWLIADLIEERLAKGVSPREIAVLTRKNAELFPLYDVLRSRAIPVLLRGKQDLLTHPLIFQLLAIFEGISHTTRDDRISGALACDCFQIHSADLGRVQSAARERKMKVIDVLLGLENDTLKLEHPERLLAARDTLLSLSQKLPTRTALETVENCIRECGLLPAKPDTALDAIDPRDAAAVEAFFSFVKSQCLERHACTFADLLADLRFYADPVYGQVRLTYELPHLTSEGIALMTAHQSKGLEFHTVMLCNFRDGHWDGSKSRSLVAIPEDLLFGWEKEQKAFEQSQDDRRLAFVAATRAKKELLLLCPRELTVGEKTKAIAPSAFFAEMGALPESDRELKDSAGASLLLRPPSRLLDGASRAYLAERLESFALSATSLSRYLNDPQEFLRIDLLQQPEHFDEGSIRRLGYGSAVHWALREWGVARQKGQEYALSNFLEAFEWYLRERTILTDHQRDALLDLGKHTLTRYFEQYLAQTQPILHAIERDYRSRIPGDDIPLKGKIDRIDLAAKNSARATVIDYKASAGKTESVIRGVEEGHVSRTKDGSHFRQLAFYALLLEKADPLLEPEAYALEYLGEKDGDPIRRSFIVTDAEKEDLRKLIREVWKRIMALEFSPLS